MHDMRTSAESHRDRDAVRELAGAVGVPCLDYPIQVNAIPGNAEANARRLRYQMLGRMAKEAGCQFVATGHHSGDQMETVLMRLVRGSSARGLAGLREQRPIVSEPGVASATLIRPMLRVDRAASEAICKAAGWQWCTDATNADLTRTRAAIRERICPILEEIAPGAAQRVARNSEAFREAAEIVAAAAGRVVRAGTTTEDGVLTLSRDVLRQSRDVVIGEVLRGTGAKGQDRIGTNAVRRVIAAIRDSMTHARQFDWPGRMIEVSSAHVRIVPVPPRSD